ncbi:tRNA-uridine aminocarboxypropyltransferase [Colwellia sp. RE-S-Sl-9]
MKRECCPLCLRAKSACICHLFTEIINDIHVVVLQHPTEVKQTKGTITLLANSLVNCTVIVGEVFKENAELTEILSLYQNEIALLYPSENAKTLTNEMVKCDKVLNSIKCIILIDGTWKKSYKMYMLNDFLHGMPHLTLPDDIESKYHIRKTQKAQALSSLEACVYALSSIETNSNKYKPLLNRFSQFNDFQLLFRQGN